MYYYISDIEGSGFYINIDNAHFIALPATEGYHEFTFTVDYAVDFFSFYVNDSTIGTFVIGSVDYDIVKNVTE